MPLSDRISKVMDRLGLEEGEVITHSMVTKSIERAQKKIEAMNFASRKNLIEYDNVMNSQREIVYNRRNYSLHEDDISGELNQIVGEFIEDSISKVSSISGNTFKWNKKSEFEGKLDTGVVAQEVEKLGLPGIVEDQKSGYKIVHYYKLVPLLIESVKELSSRVEILEQTILDK